MIRKSDVARLRAYLGLSQEKFAEKTRSIRVGCWEMGERSAKAAWSIPPRPRTSNKTVEKESDQALIPVMGYGATVKLVRTQ